MRFITICRSWVGSAVTGGSASCEIPLERGLLGDGRPEQGGHFPHFARQVELTAFDRTAAAVGQELLGELRCALGGAHHLVQVFPSRRIGGDVQPGEVGVAQDDMEEVVEVVRDPAGQHADALELLHVIGVRLARLGVAAGGLLAQPELLGELVVGRDVAHEPAEAECLVPRPAPGHGQGE